MNVVIQKRPTRAHPGPNRQVTAFISGACILQAIKNWRLEAASTLKLLRSAKLITKKQVPGCLSSAFLLTGNQAAGQQHL